MTRTTAKKGMVEHKTGYGRDDFDYNFIEELPYNDKILVKHLVNKLNVADEKNQSATEKLSVHLDMLEKEKEALKNELDALKETVKQLLTVNLGG